MPRRATSPGFSTGSYVSRRIFERFIPYIFARTDPIDWPHVFRRIDGVRNQAHRTSAMTLAQHLRQEGTLAASRQSVLEALDLRFGPVPDGLRDSIEAIADPEKLRALHRAAIISESLESFTASL